MIPSSDTGFLKDLNSCPLLPSCKNEDKYIDFFCWAFQIYSRKIAIQKVLDDADVKLHMKSTSILGIMYLTNKLYIFIATFL